MDPPQRAADRGRRRRIHDGQGLLLPSRERIDDGTNGDGDLRRNLAAAAATTTQLLKKEMGLGLLEERPPPGANEAPRGSAAATEGGGRIQETWSCDTMLQDRNGG